MGLYDVLDDIAARQVTKTETGDNRIFGVVLGLVTKNYDKNMPGRVCVAIPSRDKDANELLWARVAMPSSGKDWGHYFLPEVGDQVLLVFEQGNIERPYIIGCIPKTADGFLKKQVDEKNQFKAITTKHGSTITFEDNAEDKKGKKDKITIASAGEEHKILIDNENQVIRITDKKGKNFIEMKTETGQMTVQSEKKLTMKVGSSIEVIMNGESGKVSIKASSLECKTSGAMNLQASGKLDASGSSVKVKGASNASLESSGPVSVQGTPVKLG